MLGVEADIQGAGMSDGGTSLPIFGAVQFNQKLDWFGTVRGRVGLAHGPVLSYVTAGYAYGSVNTSVSEFGAPVFSSGNKVQGGWTVGSGVEAALGGNWTGKIEYLYLDLGKKTDSFTGFAVPQTLNTEIRENIFRVGLNYRIGGNSTYAPMRDGELDRLLSRRQPRLRHRPRPQLVRSAAARTRHFNLAPDGINGGVQAGYNWQAANWVYGLEADFQGSSQKDNKACIVSCTAAQAVAYDATLPWFGTVRGRLGYSVGSTLFYVTGGYAYGEVKTKLTGTFGGATQVNSLSNTKSGWTAGGGIETPFTLLGLFGPNWTTKTEYLYVDLGSTSAPVFGGAVPAGHRHHARHRAHLPHRPELPLQLAGGREVLIASSPIVPTASIKTPASRPGFLFAACGPADHPSRQIFGRNRHQAGRRHAALAARRGGFELIEGEAGGRNRGAHRAFGVGVAQPCSQTPRRHRSGFRR